jgi:two-component system NarL family sensor kinase
VLARDRERLMAEGMAAEERERKALAEALHDTAIQNLLSARYDLVTDLRETLFELHPYVLEQAGLEAALSAVGNRAARRGRFQLHLDARPVRPSPHERLLLSTARELLTNVAKHADARDVRLTLAEDDGQGFEESVLSTKLRNGHIGIAAHRARVESVGGRLVITSRVGAGTDAEVRVPRG